MVPFGVDVASQNVVIQTNFDGPGRDWYATVIVGELYADNAFDDLQQGSQIVNACIFNSNYDHTQLTVDTRRSEAYPVDGYPGWVTVSNLSFSIPGLITTSELAVVIIVQTSAANFSIFYTSIPNNAQQYTPDVQSALDNLHVVT